MGDVIELRRGSTALARAPVPLPATAHLAFPAAYASVVMWQTAIAFWGTLWLMPLGLTVEVTSRDGRRH